MLLGSHATHEQGIIEGDWQEGGRVKIEEELGKYKKKEQSPEIDWK